MMHANIGTRATCTSTVLLIGADRVLATESKKQFAGERRRCNQPIYLHTHTAAAERSALSTPAKALVSTAPRTFVIKLMY